MLQKTMLYIAGLAHNIWGVLVDTIEVDEHDVEDYLAQGWFRSPLDVKAAQESQTPAPTIGEGAAALETLQARIAELEGELKEQMGKTDLALEAFEDSEKARTALAKALDDANKALTARTTAGTSEPTPEEIELELKLKLAEEAAKKGVKIDGRWNSTKIQAALDKAATGAQ